MKVYLDAEMLNLGARKLMANMSTQVVGQTKAVNLIVERCQTWSAGLAPPLRPLGNFLFLGPTGTGKTKVVEAAAKALHGSERNVLRIDCGEFQLDHEVAKLIGAPPGYLGHRETQAALNQQRLNAVASEQCKLSLVLFDEIEKAAPSMVQLLLGVLDKGILRLGDSTTVNFENSLIFLTSNLGAREMGNLTQANLGFAPLDPTASMKIEKIGLAAARRRFSPEFMNRLDYVVVFQALSKEELSRILSLELSYVWLRTTRLFGDLKFEVEPAVLEFLLKEGTDARYGARPLKRAIELHVVQPLARIMATDQIREGDRIVLEMASTSAVIFTKQASRVARAATRAASGE